MAYQIIADGRIKRWAFIIIVLAMAVPMASAATSPDLVIYLGHYWQSTSVHSKVVDDVQIPDVGLNLWLQVWTGESWTTIDWTVTDETGTAFFDYIVEPDPSVPGVYTYRVVDSDSSLFTIIVEYLEPPVANFTAEPLLGSAPLSVQFTDTSTGAVAAWSWDFNNDGIIDSNIQNPSFTYGQPGNYSVKLFVDGPAADEGIIESDDELKEDYIYVEGQPPVADAGSDQIVCTATLVTLDGSGSNDHEDGSDLEYQWTIITTPEGSNAQLSGSTVVNPTFTPDIAGDYVVELVVTDTEGVQSGPDYVTITVNQPCKIEVRATKVWPAISRLKWYYHLFIVYQDSDGNQFYYEGYAENRYNPLDWGHLQTVSGPFDGSTYVVANANKAKTVTALEGSSACSKKTCLDTEINSINSGSYYYLTDGPNSNTVVSSLLNECEIPRVSPIKNVKQIPGWDYGDI